MGRLAFMGFHQRFPRAIFCAGRTPHPESRADHDEPEGRIAVAEVEFRHVEGACLRVEIHPVDTGQEGEGDEERRDQGQHPHDLVGPVAQAGVINVHQSRGEITEAFRDVDRLGHMVVAVLQEDPGAFLHEAGLIPEQVTDDFPERPGDPAHLKEDPLVLEEILQRGLARVPDEVFLQGLRLVADHLQNREKMVDRIVEQGIRQKIGRRFADEGSLLCKPLPDTGEGVLPVLGLEREDRVLVKEHAQLFNLDPKGLLRVPVDHRRDQEDAIVGLLDFRPLGRDDILDHQGIEPEVGGQDPHILRVVQALHVDPVDSLAIELADRRRSVAATDLLVGCLVITDQADDRGHGFAASL
jgi:hypothetical protein